MFWIVKSDQRRRSNICDDVEMIWCMGYWKREVVGETASVWRGHQSDKQIHSKREVI